MNKLNAFRSVSNVIAHFISFPLSVCSKLRTHRNKLESLHGKSDPSAPPCVQLFEKGYGKDPAGIAHDAIAFGGFEILFLRFYCSVV